MLLRSLLALRNLPLGFVPHNVVTTSIFLPQSGGGMVGNTGKYAGQDIAQVFYAPLLDRLAHLPGVDSAALTSILPLSPNFQAGGSFDIMGRPKDPANKTIAAIRAVSPSLYSTLGIRLLQGRLFSDSDGPQSAAVAVVNEAFVKKYFRRPESAGPATQDQRQRAARHRHDHRSRREHSPDGDVARRSSRRSTFPICNSVRTDELTPYILASFTNLALRTHVAPSTVIPEPAYHIAGRSIPTWR